MYFDSGNNDVDWGSKSIGLCRWPFSPPWIADSRIVYRWQRALYVPLSYAARPMNFYALWLWENSESRKKKLKEVSVKKWWAANCVLCSFRFPSFAKRILLMWPRKAIFIYIVFHNWESHRTNSKRLFCCVVQNISTNEESAIIPPRAFCTCTKKKKPLNVFMNAANVKMDNSCV